MSLKQSPIVGVLEGLAVFGHPKSPFALYWDDLKVKHYDSLDLEYWVRTGKHLPQVKSKFNTKVNSIIFPDGKEVKVKVKVKRKRSKPINIDKNLQKALLAI